LINLLNLINNIACNLLPQFYCLDIAYSIIILESPEYSSGLHSKKYWVVSTQIWVKNGQTQMLG